MANELGAQLGLDPDVLKMHGGYRARVDTPDGPVQMHLAELTTMDPPLGRAAAIGAEFIDLTQARGLSVIELELLRLAYEYVM